MSRRFLTFSVLFLLLLSMAGCINIDQEIVINQNGTGSFAMDIGISESLLAMMEEQGGFEGFGNLESNLQSDNPYIEKAETGEYNEDGYKHYTISADINDMEGFLGQLENTEDSTLAIRLEKLDNGNIRYTQLVSMNTNQDGEAPDEMAAGLMASALQGQYWKVRLQAPNLVETNGRVDEETGTVEWSVPMTDLLLKNDTVELTAEYKTSLFPTTLLIAMGIGLLVILALVVVFFFLRRKRGVEADTLPAPQV